MSFLHLRARSLWPNIKQRIRQWMKPDNDSPALNAALDLSRSKSELMVENAFLTSKLRGWKEAVIIVKPDTVLRWHRDQCSMACTTPIPG